MKQRTEIIPNGQLIERIRILAGRNKLQVAEAAGIPHSSVIRAERGQSVSAKTAAGICAALDKEFDELFTIKRPGGGVSSTAEKGA